MIQVSMFLEKTIWGMEQQTSTWYVVISKSWANLACSFSRKLRESKKMPCITHGRVPVPSLFVHAFVHSHLLTKCNVAPERSCDRNGKLSSILPASTPVTDFCSAFCATHFIRT